MRRSKSKPKPILIGIAIPIPIPSLIPILSCSSESESVVSFASLFHLSHSVWVCVGVWLCVWIAVCMSAGQDKRKSEDIAILSAGPEKNAISAESIAHQKFPRRQRKLDEHFFFLPLRCNKKFKKKKRKGTVDIYIYICIVGGKIENGSGKSLATGRPTEHTK